jgi:hypothetical protein
MANGRIDRDGGIERFPAFCRELGRAARIGDWPGAERSADRLAAAWATVRPSILRGSAGRGVATAIDGTINWIAVAIGRRDAAAAVKASAELTLEAGRVLGRLAA